MAINIWDKYFNPNSIKSGRFAMQASWLKCQLIRHLINIISKTYRFTNNLGRYLAGHHIDVNYNLFIF